jgi:hypothetical protein
VTDNHLHVRIASGVARDPFESVVSTGRVVQAKTEHGLAGLNEMHVGIDERRCDEPSSKINFVVPGRCPARGLIAADEADHSPVGHEASCLWVPRGVHAAPDEDHELVRPGR